MTQTLATQQPNPQHILDVHPWKIQEDTLYPPHLTLGETLFSLANGFIGTRGTFEEGITDNPTSCEGTYLNGVYVRDPIHYEEVAHAFATHNDKMLQVPDAKAIRIYIDGTLFMPSALSAESHTRSLNFRRGVLERDTLWQLGGDRQLRIISRRLVSFEHQHRMLQETIVTPLGFSGKIAVESLFGISHLLTHAKDAVDPRAGHLSVEDSLRYISHEISDDMMIFLHEAEGSGFVVGSAVAHKASHNGVNLSAAGAVANTSDAPNALTTRYEMQLADGEDFTLTKYISYHYGEHNDDDTIMARLKEDTTRARVTGFNACADVQATHLDAYWRSADITISGDASLQQGIRFNLYHIFQSAGRDGKRAIGAKGLSGPGYDGHYFWDTEIYIVPFFIYSSPAIARKLLEYRYSILDAARNRARQMSHKHGALYAWRTIGGDECSAYFPAGTAQYHINAAIAHAILCFYEATGDWEFIERFGAEMLLETARIWSDIGHFSDYKDGKFCINEVTGPDEYSAMVDNNFYTNAMARRHLRGACAIIKEYRERNAKGAKALEKAIGLKEEELTRWQKAVDNMYLPYDEKLDINPQDDGFLGKPVWDFANTPKENHPLLLHYHPLVIHRHQVLKQADTVLAMALLGHEFDTRIRRNNLDYYMPLTTHDSTLSTCMYSVECARAGKRKEAYAFFEETARMDLDNLHRNTQYGLHTACMAGSWISIVMGFAGMESHDGQLYFAPHCPERWDDFSFSVKVKNIVLHITVDANNAHYTMTGAQEYAIIHCGERVILHNNQSLTLAYKDV